MQLDTVTNDSPTPIARATREALTQLVEPICAAHGCALVLLEWSLDRVLRLFIEREQDGDARAASVTVDDCQRVSRDVSAALDVADLIAGSYRLEVSSPGLDRPLVGERDFLRFVGSRAKVQLREPVEGRRKFDGIIASAEAARVVLLQDGKPVAFAVDDIAKAHLVWEPPPKGRGPRTAS